MATKTITINVPDMSTEHCADDVLRAIHSVPGVSQAHVSLESNSAVVEYDEALAEAGDFLQAIDEQGYNALLGGA